MAEQMLNHIEHDDDDMTMLASESGSPSSTVSTLRSYDTQSTIVCNKFYEFYKTGELCDIELRTAVDDHR